MKSNNIIADKTVFINSSENIDKGSSEELLAYAAKVAADLMLAKEYITVPLPMANFLGLKQAVLLKTIDNWCNSNENRQNQHYFKNGYYWTYGSYDEWSKRIPCLGNAKKLQRLFLSLEADGFLISDVLSSFKFDRRKWYRVDAQKLGLMYIAKLETQPELYLDPTPVTKFEDYRDFLQGDYWRSVRQKVLRRDKYCCQQCKSKKSLHVHHITYEHHGFEHENLQDLLTLCKVCHASIHGKEVLS